MKSIFLFVIMTIFPGATFAGENIAVGVQGGATFPNFHIKNSAFASQYGGQDGWLVGVYGEIGIMAFALRPELNYVTKGYSVANTAETRNRYLEIPLLLKFNPFEASRLSTFIVIGPQWSYHRGSNFTVANSSIVYRNSVDRSDISAVAGLGIDLNIFETFSANFQGRYSFGFRDVDSSAAQVRARTFYAIAGISLRDAF